MAEQRPRAVFMAFGTKGDVLPVATIAAALARDQAQYHVSLITHADHEYLKVHISSSNVSYVPILTPPVLSMEEHGTDSLSFSSWKLAIREKCKSECLSAVESIFKEGSIVTGDFIAINFFALEGWHLAELFQIPCVVTAPYVVPYSMPSSYESQFQSDFPLLYGCLQEAYVGKVCWKDVAHWMWPLFMEGWGFWRSSLNLSPCPLTDPVTSLPLLHNWPESPIVLYGFSEEIVEYPDYWPSGVHVCGFWFPPLKWEFSCINCAENAAAFPSNESEVNIKLCTKHRALQNFLEKNSEICSPIFIGLSSIGRMGFMRNPAAFLSVLKAIVESTSHRIILFSGGYEPLDNTIKDVLQESLNGDRQQKYLSSEDGILLFDDKLFCFSGSIPYKWVFSRCSIAIHHGGRYTTYSFTVLSNLGHKIAIHSSERCTACDFNTQSGSTAAALLAGIPQILCPFILDQFYWAERMYWLGVAPQPLRRNCLVPDESDDTTIREAANVLSHTIKLALSAKIKARTSQICAKIHEEDGVGKALKILKEAGICLVAS